MLYLTRKIGQSIVINGDIEVQIVEIKGKTVKVGLEFPKNASVLRKEVYDKVVEQNLAASQDMGFGGFGEITTEKDGNTID